MAKCCSSAEADWLDFVAMVGHKAETGLLGCHLLKQGGPGLKQHMKDARITGPKP